MNKKNLPLQYHQAKEIINREISSYRSAVSQPLPEVTFEQKGDTASVHFKIPLHADLYKLLAEVSQVLGKATIDASYHSATLQNETMTLYLSNYAQLDKSLKFNTRTAYSNSDSSQEGFTSQDIEAIITAYKCANSLSEKSSPKQRLADVGVRIYETGQKLDWEHLAGYENVKQEIKDTIILPLRYAEVYDSIVQGTRKYVESNRAKAVLFEGPPGTGKTTAARIIAGDVEVPLIYVPIESIVSKWYGESEQRLAEIFDASAELGSSLLFLDEIDALGVSRDQEIHEASRRVLSVLLRKMDGFEANDKTMLIGATNRKEDLDRALLSRFDVTVQFPNPNQDQRSAIFGNYAQHLVKDELETLAKQSEGISGRNIKDICEHTERRWVSRLLSGDGVEGLPSLPSYLSSLKLKKEK